VRRNANASDDSGCTLTNAITRGFTQMLDSFCLVNMNCRVDDRLYVSPTHRSQSSAEKSQKQG
jgi:hypothetical protein